MGSGAHRSPRRDRARLPLGSALGSPRVKTDACPYNKMDAPSPKLPSSWTDHTTPKTPNTIKTASQQQHTTASHTLTPPHPIPE
ncbi:hypothetical protein GGTG_04983 [Gaeumannomyces tritici R3-111a-1]|uniref:Uncharacterized protein n=1 Tax=Gaeumannomyces tritici (strain R3-111a-1) TaxID=644352 RepID=J3NUM7_GAET3|nr:hypothetical protein GGTG_04983 [Gaeumannomyces tritici R3-111a-1]EJT79901.1 hypothetical protein GGTG_04983 [Gaeumannomyces tritici R3-111a-1]